MGTRAESDTHPEDVAKRDPALWARATQLVLQLCPPAETVVGLSGVGEVAFRTNLLERQACTAWWEDGQAYGESVALEYAGQTGVLLMEDRLALALVNAVLGVGMPPICGPLSRIERGILEGIVMAVLAKLSPTGTIRVRSGAGTVVAAAPPAGSFGVELPSPLACSRWPPRARSSGSARGPWSASWSGSAKPSGCRRWPCCWSGSFTARFTHASGQNKRHML